MAPALRRGLLLSGIMSTMLSWRRTCSLKSPLYRDHEGRFVLLDVEAPCRLVASETDARLTAIVDGVAGTVRKGMTAHESLTICAQMFSPFRAEWTETFYAEPPPSGRAAVVDLPKGIETDYIDIADKESRKAHKLNVQNSSEVLTHESRQYVMHLNTMEFEAAIGSGVVAIRRMYDGFHGKQRARLLIDGEMAGWWYTPEENRKKRWAESTFVVNPKLTKGKSQLRITVDPPAGTPLWSVAHYRVFDLGKL